MIHRYSLPNNSDLNRQRSVGKVADLEDSLALTHSLIEDAVAAGNVGMANSLLVTASKLAREVEQQRIRAGTLIEKSKMLEIIRAVTDLIVAEFCDKLSDVDVAIFSDTLCPKICAMIENMTAPKQLLLEGPKNA